MAPSSGNQPPEFSFRTRQRAWDDLKARQHPLNVLIVGGGIVGAGILRELARHQVSDCVLVEKGDFASGTSGASSKLIHAGIRYLEQAWDRLLEGRVTDAWRDFRFVLEASRERKVLGRLAPGLVRPKRIYVILGEGNERSPLSVFAGTWAYYLMQLLQGQFFAPPGACLSQAAVRRRFPDLDAAQVRGVFSFCDSETDDARLVIENLQAAVSGGAAALNYVELISYQESPDAVTATLRNQETAETAVIRAKLLINAGGAHVDDVAAHGETAVEPMIDRVAGAHIDVHPAVTQNSFYITASDGRLVFILRRDEDGLVYSRIGTTERPLTAGESSDAPKATPEEISYLTNLVHTFFPKARIDRTTVVGVDAGIRALRRQSDLDAFKKSREHAILGANRVFHLVGVKLTDFRRVASEVLDTLPWARAGIAIGTAPAQRPLREEGGKIYRESTSEDVVMRTMVLHWDDYVLRRRGALPRVLRRDDPGRLDKEMDEVSRLLGWTAETILAEKARVTPPILP